ncbi:hypothetical protein V8E51_010420 [Hyaloscypha variabilis]
MSDDEQPQFSDLEGSDIDNIKDNDNGNSRLHDPTGQYANAYARAGMAIPASWPAPSPSLTPQQPVQKLTRQPGSQGLFPEPPRSVRPSNASSPSQDSIAFSFQNGRREHSRFYNQPRAFGSNQARSFREPNRHRGPAVARVVSRHYLPAHHNRTPLDNIAEDEPLREPLYNDSAHHFPSSSQYGNQPGDATESEHTSPRFMLQGPFASDQSTSRPFVSQSHTSPPFASTPFASNPFALNPLASAPFASEPLTEPLAKRDSHSRSHHNFSNFEQSPPSSVQYQESYHNGPGLSREVIPYDSDYGYAAEGYAAMPRQAKRSYESMDDDSESGIFVEVSGRRVVPAGSDGSVGSSGNPAKSRRRFSQDSLLSYDNSGPRPQPGQRPDAEYFNNPGKNLAQSRFSGGQNNWGVNKVPVLVPEEEVSDAALLKRGLKRGDGAKVCKRGYGANDPENIAIVHMFEKDRMSFDAICNKLNADRIANGKAPTLTPNGCQTRFNRNAPILFSAEGREFIPLGMRQRGQRMDDIAPTNPTPKVAWDDELDLALVETVKEWESRKWEDVAALFKRKTGVEMDAGSCAHRHHII